jgi:ADP-heptose:LPS heptosyltransferase
LRFENKKKILFASLGGIGDLVFNMAVVDEVKKLNHNSKVTFALGNKQFIDILELNPNIDKIISYPEFGDGSLKSFHNKKLELEEEYDQVVLFNQPDSKIKNKWKRKIIRWLQIKGFHLDKRHLFERYADIAKVKLKNKTTKFYYNQKDEVIADQFLKEKRIAKSDFVVTVAHTTGGSRFLKNWPTVKFEQLITQITNDLACKVIVFGGKKDPVLNANSAIHALGFPLRPTACIIKGSKLFIGMDSGLTHIAGCFRCPIVSIHSGYPVFESGSISDLATFIYKGPFKDPSLITVDEVYKVVASKIGEIRKQANQNL